MAGQAEEEWVVLDDGLRLGIQRTLRVPETGGPYPLPPGLGRTRVLSADALGGDARLDADAVVPLHPHEAIWLQFRGAPGDPRAVKLAVGRIDALTGQPWTLQLESDPQNYIVCPYQPWLDGFHTESGVVRQFVAVPLRTGESVEHQLTGVDTGGITVACYRPDQPLEPMPRAPAGQGGQRQLGVGAGGRIHQRVYPDPYGRDRWQPSPVSVKKIVLMDARDFSRRFNLVVPPSPIDAGTYTRFGLPWFEVYDEPRGDIPAPAAFTHLKPIDTAVADDDRTVDAPTEPTNVKRIPFRSRKRGDG